jgi:hypothetical protein
MEKARGKRPADHGDQSRYDHTEADAAAERAARRGNIACAEKLPDAHGRRIAQAEHSRKQQEHDDVAVAAKALSPIRRPTQIELIDPLSVWMTLPISIGIEKPIKVRRIGPSVRSPIRGWPRPVCSVRMVLFTVTPCAAKTG